jgi:hypothetical protein
MAENVEKEQAIQFDKKGMHCDFVPPSEDRLHPILAEKATKYKALADEVRHGEHGLFHLYLHLGGVCHFESIWTPDQGQVYGFQFYENQGATRPIELPSGFVPRPIPARATGTDKNLSG